MPGATRIRDGSTPPGRAAARSGPPPGGALLSGRYGYHHGDGLLLYLPLGLIAGIIGGALLALGGAALAWQTPRALWRSAFGWAVLGTSVALIVDGHDGGFSREREAIARYLARVRRSPPGGETSGGHERRRMASRRAPARRARDAQARHPRPRRACADAASPAALS